MSPVLTRMFSKTRDRVMAVAMLVITALVMGFAPQAMAQSAGDYRSAATGTWSTAATWQRFDGSTWVTATVAPSSTDGAITIRNGHTVTISASVTIDQVTIDAGGQLTSSGTTPVVTLANGTGTDLVVNGTFLNSSTAASSFGISTGANWSVGAGGTYIHNTNAGVSTPLNSATLEIGRAHV